jgi:CRP-like cAMP-binding protein
MGCSSAKATETGGQADETLQFLSKVRLFKRLPQPDHKALADAMVPQTYQAGQAIITQGDDGDSFYIIKSGGCDVVIEEKKVAELRAGDFFGEVALLRDEPRTATIKARAKVETLCVTRDTFGKLGLHSKLDFPKRNAVAGGAAKVSVKPPSPKTSQERTLMTQALKNNQNLNSTVALDDDKILQIIDVMWVGECVKGTKLITQGDLKADYFYVILKGEFEILKSDEGGNNTQQAASAPLGKIGPGGSFGELALLYTAPRAATVVAATDAKWMMIDRPQFKNILAKASDTMTKEYFKYLDNMEIFDALKDEEKNLLAQSLLEKQLVKDEIIFEEGDKGDMFYILVDGNVKVMKAGKQVADLKATATQPQFFGEKALLNNEPRAATLKVTSAGASALCVDKQSFDMLLGPLDQLQKRGKTGTAAIAKVGAGGAAEGRKFGLINRKDLKRLGLLGCGGFGAVEMVEHVKTSETFALKALSKGYVVKSGMQQSVISEKNVQLMCDSPFIVTLYETYNGDQSLYFLLELALGGELYATYNKKNMWGNDTCAKYYVAGTTYAFEHLHAKKIVFRDLKPENLLLNDSGHVKLTDMGLAKVIVGKTFTTCGTPDYFAPELIASKGHTQAVDWWTLGVLSFELLSGHPPFESATPMQIYQKVTKGIQRVAFPKKCKGHAETFIKALCNSDPQQRLAVKKGGIKNIQDHPWYGGFEWDAMMNRTMKVPYKPTVKSKKDNGNFSARREDMPPQVHYKDDKSGWDKGFATSS